MNWIAFATKLPVLIHGVVSVVQKIKGATGAEKKQAVIDSIPESLGLVEFAAGKDILSDENIMKLVSAAIDAEAAALKAREALKAGLLAKAPPPVA